MVASSNAARTTSCLREGGLYQQIYDLQLRDQEEFLALEERVEESVRVSECQVSGVNVIS